MTKEKRRTILMNLLVTIAILTVIEVTSYILLQKVYNRKFDSELIEDNMYYTSAGLKPNRQTRVWGRQFSTDYYGGRLNPSATGNKRKWLFIGDSVTEGVGVNDSSTFAALTQCARQTEDIYNLSLIGYSLPDYVNVVKFALERDLDIDRVTLFYCLNDVYGTAKSTDLPVMGKASVIGSTSRLLQEYCNTYKMVKLLVFHDSNSYFKYDLQFYKQDNERFKESMEALSDFNTICREHGIIPGIVLLPYRSQLKPKNADTQLPQKLVMDYCKAHGIRAWNAAPFLTETQSPEALYLFADEIHFSEQGHKEMAEFICSRVYSRGGGRKSNEMVERVKKPELQQGK